MMMMIKERRDVRPILVKFGVALAIYFAGFLSARFRNNRIKPPDSPPSRLPNPECSKKVDYEGRLRVKDDHYPEINSIDSYDKPRIRVRASTPSKQASPSGDKDGFLLPEFDELVNDLPKTIYSVERDDHEHEIDNLKRTVRYLRERERKLEVQLLECYGLKEQETAMMELQNRLKINNIEAKLFSMKIESLEAENKRLSAQVVDYSKVVSELEDAKAKIKLLKRKIRYEAQQNKELIMDLAQRVTRLRDNEEHEACTSDSNVHSELRKMSDLEKEAEELKKSNENLKQENVDLARRLESTQFLANSFLEDSEKEELNKEIENLREENQKLTKEADKLQENWCGDAEELVYLRWINACLRYELRNYQPPPGKTVARDLSKCLSPTSEKKAKNLILEYANTEDGDQKNPSMSEFDFENWPSSSHQSYLTDSDDSPRHGSSNKHKKLRIFARLRRLITGKHGHHYNNQSDHSPIYRSQSVDDLRKRYQEGVDESLKLASPSQNSNNSLLEFQPLSRLDEEDANDIGKTNRMSDSTRSSNGGVSFVPGSEINNNSPRNYSSKQDLEDGQKSDLAKYAETLRDSKSLLRMHKKSASYSIG